MIDGMKNLNEEREAFIRAQAAKKAREFKVARITFAINFGDTHTVDVEYVGPDPLQAEQYLYSKIEDEHKPKFQNVEWQTERASISLFTPQAKIHRLKIHLKDEKLLHTKSCQEWILQAAEQVKKIQKNRPKEVKKESK